MEFVLTIHVDDNDTGRPGITIAQIMREMTPIIENANPLLPGVYKDRSSGVPQAAWQTWNYEPLATAPIINTHAPDPGEVGEGTFGFSITGNFFPEGAVLYLDGVPCRTDVYSQWSITGNAPKRAAPGNVQAMLMYDGIGYAHFIWAFAEAAPGQQPAPVK